jgi:hypothetical protein
MIKVDGMSGDITFFVYDKVSRNMDEERLAKWANNGARYMQLGNPKRKVWW